MTKALADPESADDFCEDCGYEPELKRTLNSFQVFAVSFAFISVAVGIFGTYDDLLRNSGPVGIWTWIIAAVGQLLIALVVAQFAARIPLSGSSYQWGSRLANPKIGWFFGWLSSCYLITGLIAIDSAMSSTLRKRLGRQEGAFNIGRFELPVSIAALIWSICAIVILLSPANALVPIIIVTGLLAVGTLYFVYMMIFNRQVLDHEPGDLTVFSY